MAVSIKVLNAGNMTIGSGGHPETRVKYTEASGIPDATFNIVGELTYESIDNLNVVEEVDIGDTVTSIGEAIFAGTWLMSITIPNSVTSIGSGAFMGCQNITNITVQGKTLTQV